MWALLKEDKQEGIKGSNLIPTKENFNDNSKGTDDDEEDFITIGPCIQLSLEKGHGATEIWATVFDRKYMAEEQTKQQSSS